MQNPILEYSVDDIFILIPARSGSKGVQRKNLQKINGKTLVEITIGQALLAGNAENIYLSSDSNEILQYAEILNIKSIQRTSKESSDESDANSVVKHFIFSKSLEDALNKTIVYLQPTSPFRGKNLISECIGLHNKHSLSVVTVRRIVDHPLKTITVVDGKIKNYLPGFMPTGNRQNLPDLLIPSGSVYVFSIKNFIENGYKIPIINAMAVEVEMEDAFDIDTELDLWVAQKIGENYEF
jgi:CMP-N,N'-diacetyllegionaminic acid synthase